ncbi:hypothetical protein ONZ45_g11221 [Pleurotus djamor]|nr:hypothetical protein ONZ45_g11221 [Pleurotus djamor]
MSSLTDIPPLLTPSPPLPSRQSSTNPDVLLRVKTPYNADAFDRFFTAFPHLKQQYPNLTHKLRHGFPMGNFPEKLDKTVTWPNGRSVDKHPEFMAEYFAEEVEAGRLSGPYSRSEVEGILGGPFQCSPVTVNIQPQGPGVDPKLRLCSDFSRLADVVAKAPEGTQAMTLDISKFHRRTPIAPAHKKWYVMQTKPGEYYIQHCAPFGARSSEGNSGEIANAALDIWRELGVGPICKWADDMVVFRSPIPGTKDVYEYDRPEALRRIEDLNIPWHPEKGQDFAPQFTYVGLDWDLNRKAVSLPPTKRDSFLQRLDDYLKAPIASRMETLIIQGTLAHVIYVYPEGRTHLLHLSRFISSFESLKVETQTLPSVLREDLEWWVATLMKHGVARSVIPKGPPQNFGISVDASGDWGIGIIYQDSWDAYRSIPGWNAPGRDIGWLEGVAVELMVYILEMKGIKDMHVLIHSDNQGVIGAFNKGISRNVETNLCIQRTGASLLARNNSLHLEYVRSENNPADPISRGKFGSPETRLPPITLPAELRPYLERATTPSDWSPKSHLPSASGWIDMVTNITQGMFRLY